MLKTRHWLLKIHHQANLCALPLLQRMENFIDLGGLVHIGSKANPILNLEVHYTLDTKREWKRCWYFSQQNHKAEVLRHRLFQRGMRLQWASITNPGSPIPMAPSQNEASSFCKYVSGVCLVPHGTPGVVLSRHHLGIPFPILITLCLPSGCSLFKSRAGA